MKFKIILLIIIIQLICCQIIVSQNKSISKNSIYYEFYGTGWGPISVNYDRVLSISDKMLIAPGLGVSLTKCIHVGGTFNLGEYQTFFPAKIDFLFGKKNHKFEFGFGMPFSIDNYNKDRFLIGGVYVLRLGYRYKPASHGFIFRASINPSIIAIMPMISAGLSVGYTF